MKIERESLSEHYESVQVPTTGPSLRRWWAIAGPALLVSVGYMDPGNWATDLAGGSRYNYALLWVLLMSNLMAMLLQSLAARLGVVCRRDLAQACRESFPAWVNIPLYLLAEIAIIATDLAEVLGSAIAFQLLFGIPLLWGVVITTFDVLLLLALTSFGIRRLEAVILSFVATIGVAFVIEIFLARPDWGGVLGGFVPSLPDEGALYIAIGILGATVMPHNLYLHSSLVQTRLVGRTEEDIRASIRLNTVDSVISLNLAFLVNAAILIMAAAVFYRAGLHDIAEIQDAYRMLEPILGAAIAPVAFALALLASGQSSTITATLAGQIVMEGHLAIRIRPWLRRLITRLLAAGPAVLAILWFGERSTGDLLVLSQVVLSLQLPFAVIPLIHFVADRRRMRSFAVGPVIQGLAWLVATVIVGLNLKLVTDEITLWLEAAGERAWILQVTVLPLVGLLLALLAYVTIRPWIDRLAAFPRPAPAPGIHGRMEAADIAVRPAAGYRRIAVALDFGDGEEQLVNEALRFADRETTDIVLMHVVESPVARAMGDNAADFETEADRRRLEELCGRLREAGYRASCRLGLGDPISELARLVEEEGVEAVVLGAHGHRGLTDLVYGNTASALRHRIDATVIICPLRPASES